MREARRRRRRREYQKGKQSVGCTVGERNVQMSFSMLAAYQLHENLSFRGIKKRVPTRTVCWIFTIYGFGLLPRSFISVLGCFCVLRILFVSLLTAKQHPASSFYSKNISAEIDIIETDKFAFDFGLVHEVREKKKAKP